MQNAIAEDISTGDHSSLSTIPEDSKVEAIMLCKDNGIIAGINRAEEIFHFYDPTISITKHANDGDLVKHGDTLLSLKGNARNILAMERIALNVMQRMSGIATFTNYLNNKIKHTSTKILDTRKTTPGLRFLEKEAVVIGGGKNHRMGLYDMIMIKDNHVDFSGGIAIAIDKANEYIKSKHLEINIEVEVRNFEELETVLNKGKVQRIMLDNFSISDLKEAVKRINHRYETEASGGINENTIVNYAETGVDYISVGALTHTVKNFDISLIAKPHEQ
ncbi:MAG: carboxylating nicotinate-nucleotide diphosphorylase [Flavobacteriales bacterium]